MSTASAKPTHSINPAAFLILALLIPVARAQDTAAMRDPFSRPAAPVADSAAPAAPMQEAVKLSTQGAFTSPAPRVGDSLDYVVQVEWEDTQVPVIVLAPDSVDFPGFKVIGQATVHKKLASGQTVRNHTEFIFRLRAATQGTGKAASMKVRYLTGISRQEEAVFIPTALTDIQAAPVNPFATVWFKLLLYLAVFGGIGVLGAYSYKIAARKRAEKAPKRADLKPAVLELKNRLRTAQNNPDAGKAFLLEMETLASRFLADGLEAAGNLPGKSAPAPNARFEPMLDAYLAGPGAADGTAAEWARLKELFRHARFAGGYKEPHELQDAFRTFRKCLKITGEDEHE
jgi:hypothetical protein